MHGKSLLHHRLLIAAVLLLTGLAGLLAAAERTTLIWKGCSITKIAFMVGCARAYEAKTGVHIELVGGGATLGIRSTLAGDADMGGTCRPSRPDLFPDLEAGGVLIHAGWDAICYITHPENPVTDITADQARQILLGEITNWQEVGGPDQPIFLINRRQDEDDRFSGVGYMTRRLLFKNPDVKYADRAITFRDSGLVERNVEKIRWSFAADGFASACHRQVKILAVDGIACTRENIMAGRYPFFRPLYLITHGQPAGEVKRFIDWLLGAEGQAVVKAEGTINLAEGRQLALQFKAWEQLDQFYNPPAGIERRDSGDRP
ncbi:MAG: hypothetical protein A2521_16970 [Deltaproteobacteria bacterium RIFOXYD12_FULL_57_12]|nr:MAG: hypothetical protein A2521_16970 [Deltaproteobacteria bacterium RIFOXYD12_FULL_57_12]